MIYFADKILAELETKLLDKGTAASFGVVGDNPYRALTVLPTPFDSNHPDKKNTIVLWSLMGVSGAVADDVDQIKLFCKLSEGVTKERLPDLLEYLNYANSMLDFGTFCIDSSGQVGFGYGYPVIDSGNTQAMAEALEIVIGCATFAMKTASVPLQRLLKDRMTVSEAKDMLRLLLEIVDEHIND